jgi:NAD(P)-dependent dehydrogenase (short-subunit alcohol dehydrogenase family)
VTPESFQRVFAVNTLGSLLTVQKALTLLRDGGSIILNGTASISKGFPGASVYSASKAANRSLVRTLGGRTARTEHPGEHPQPRCGPHPCAGAAAGTGARVHRRPGAAGPVRRASGGRGRRVFLACDDSSFITGVELAIDGGLAQV